MKKSLGIIGGSGLYVMEHMNLHNYHRIDTAWGDTSGPIAECKYNDETIFFLARHGEGHTIPPSKINYRANIEAFKKLGVTDILSISSVGSLNENLAPGSFIIIDQFIDFTRNRDSTFFDDIVVHVSMAHPTDKSLMHISKQALEQLSITHQYGGLYLCIEGPQFSTLRESKLFQSWGCDVVGMTGMPEAKLCREASLRYASICMITDYDCWHPDYENVEVTNVLSTVNNNTKKAKKLIEVFSALYSETSIKNNLNSFNSLVTRKDKIKEDIALKLQNIMPDLLKSLDSD
tara:strand:- start:2 stop:871 length:870 start_codon:yes stop_codon:yes gene_type:complete